MSYDFVVGTIIVTSVGKDTIDKAYSSLVNLAGRVAITVIKENTYLAKEPAGKFMYT